MKRFPILLAAMTAVPGIATELHVFSAGQAAKAQEVNDNFQRLDTAIQNRATKASLESTDGALKSVMSTVGTLQTGKAEKSDLDALSAKQKTDVATLAKATVDSANAIRNSFPTLSLPQDLAPTSSPTFAGAVVKGAISGYHARFGGGVSSSPNVFIDAGEGYTSQLSHAVAGVTRWTEQLYLADTYRWVARDATGATIDFPFQISTPSGGEIRLGGATARPVSLTGPLTGQTAKFSEMKAGWTGASTSGVIRLYGGGASQPTLAFHELVGGILRFVQRWDPSADVLEIAARNDDGSARASRLRIPRADSSSVAVRLGLYVESGDFRAASLGGSGVRPVVAGQTGVVATQDVATFRATIDAAQTNHSHDAAYLKNTGGTITGDLRISGKLTTPPGATPADYVFEPDYKLAPLSEVEAFTKEHKHLPEVPSAKEMTENGVDMAAMNMVLLKKVEELTLHAIALQKALEAQKAQFEQRLQRLESTSR